MTTDLSQYNANELPSADVLSRQRYAIVVADWNSEITHALAKGAIDTLVKHGVKEENIDVMHVPGTVELTYGAMLYLSGQKMFRLRKHADAIIVIGCVIQGDTPHFDYVCQSVTQGVTLLNAQGGGAGGYYQPHFCPVIFSVLTTLDKQQALDRAGGRLGNKGVEGAITAIKMANLV
jgi:6,7-dimethyl-8-ribityllumazine synthase